MTHYELRKLLVQNNIPFNETWDYFETPDLIIPKMGSKVKLLNANISIVDFPWRLGYHYISQLLLRREEKQMNKILESAFQDVMESHLKIRKKYLSVGGTWECTFTCYGRQLYHRKGTVVKIKQIEKEDQLVLSLLTHLDDYASEFWINDSIPLEQFFIML